ncbi:hypothetical protein SCLCIDRAFT_1209392 [Scleroderma citrinum Foug A]|uniref:Uncharacterized protein n=1 Tax=Scleroderma citrinum Foug A TaxID=1036808 RepID=A0A0C3E5D1_9AGAM|nr:hypothetical protein SCLCIDRAFT_1209392 [Scleroderma citrinum Foug A]
MNHGTVAVALVQRQVMIIQATQTHSRRDRWLDVYTYVPFGDRLFLASAVPQARIASSDLLVTFPFRTPTTDMIELPEYAYREFLELSARHQLKYENMWRTSKACRR